MYQAIKNFFSDKAREEQYRPDFEKVNLASGQDKAVRFARLENGKYADANLELVWREWVREQIMIDDVV